MKKKNYDFKIVINVIFRNGQKTKNKIIITKKSINYFIIK